MTVACLDGIVVTIRVVESSLILCLTRYSVVKFCNVDNLQMLQHILLVYINGIFILYLEKIYCSLVSIREGTQRYCFNFIT